MTPGEAVTLGLVGGVIGGLLVPLAYLLLIAAIDAILDRCI